MSGNEEDYVLARGYLPSARLNLLQFLWRETLGYYLHPVIPTEQSNVKIAEVATGTGLWLCELAGTLPSSAQLDGFDLSSEQFIQSSSLPLNVRLMVGDAREDPPDALCGIYDVVHVRLLIAAVENDDPGLIIRHCLKLLKPGGFLQWDEVDPWSMMPDPRQDPLPTPNLEEIVNVFKFTKTTGWIPRLPEYFQSNGLETVASNTYKEKPWHKQMFMEMWCLVVDEHAGEMERRGALEKADGLRKLANEAHREIRHGGSYSQGVQTVVGRKV